MSEPVLETTDVGVLWEADREVDDPSESEIVDWAQRTLSAQSVENCELAIKIVTAIESEELNARYRQKHSPTNVLSFPLDSGLPDQRLLLGDLAICAEVVRVEALAQGKSVSAHFSHMVVHGVLHLLGFDHLDPAEALEMEQIEQNILSTMGVADPYLVIES